MVETELRRGPCGFCGEAFPLRFRGDHPAELGVIWPYRIVLQAYATHPRRWILSLHGATSEAVLGPVLQIVAELQLALGPCPYSDVFHQRGIGIPSRESLEVF